MRLTVGCLSSPIRIVSFDAMDTLIRPRIPIWVTYQQFAAREKLDFPEELVKDCFLRSYKSFSQLYPCFGNSKQQPLIIEGTEGLDMKSDKPWWLAVVRSTFTCALEKWKPSKDISECSDKINNISLNLYDHFCTGEPWFVYEDTEKTLKDLRSKGIRTIVLSNWDYRLKHVLKELHLFDYFEAFFLSGDLGIAKPSPEIFKFAEISLKVKDPSELLHVGDDVFKDYLPAKDLGFQALLLVYELERFRTDPGLEKVPKNRIIQHVSQVLEFV